MSDSLLDNAEGLKRLIDYIDKFTVREFGKFITTLTIIDEEKIDVEIAITVCKYLMNDIGRYLDEDERRRLNND